MPFSAPVLTYRAKGLASNIQSKVLKVHNTLININITAISAPEMTYTPNFYGVPESFYFLRKSFYSTVLNIYSAVLNIYSAVLNMYSKVLNKNYRADRENF